jgi:hypothetical protein
MIALGVFALVIALGEWGQAQAQDPTPPYASMAPLDQYLMVDRDAEIAMARSAAPEAISRDADVLVLGRHGYETAVKGKNGFVWVAERSWMLPYDDPEFWNRCNRANSVVHDCVDVHRGWRFATAIRASSIALAAFGAGSAIELLSAATITR